MKLDPYHEWLKVSSQQRPPNYYDLLGLPLFEQDVERIKQASLTQNAAVLKYKIGKYEEDAQRILSELSVAFVCLTDADRKRAYDRQLSGLATVEPPAVTEAPVLPPSIAAPPTAHASGPARAQGIQAVVATRVEGRVQDMPRPGRSGPRTASGARLRAGLHCLDRALATIAGEDNVILHWFLRLLAPALAMALLVSIALVAASVMSVRREPMDVAAAPPQPPIPQTKAEPPKSVKQERPLEVGGEAVVEAERAWEAALAAVDQKLLDRHSREQFAAAREKAGSAKLKWGAGDRVAAVQLFQQARQMLLAAGRDALKARDFDPLDGLMRELQAAIRNRDVLLAASLLARFEQLAPQEPRLAALQETVRRLPPAIGQQQGLFVGRPNVWIYSAVFSPDGREVLGGLRDGTAIIWNTATGKMRRLLSGHTKDVTSVACSPNGQTLLTGSKDKTAIVWDAGTGQRLRSLTGHSDFVNCVAFSPDNRQVVTGSGDDTLILWDSTTGRQLRTFSGHSNNVRAVAFNFDGSQILSGANDKTAALWDTSSGQRLHVFLGHSDTVMCVAFSPDGRRALTGARDKTAILWDCTSHLKLNTFEGHDGVVRSVAFSPQADKVLTGSDDDSALLWDVATGRQLVHFQGHNSDVGSAVFSPDGSQVLTASDDGTAILWSTAVGH